MMGETFKYCVPIAGALGFSAEDTAEALVGKNAMSGFLALMNSRETDINKLRGVIENCDGASESMAETIHQFLCNVERT